MTQTPLYLTSELVSAYVAHNQLPLKELEMLLRAVHHAFSSCGAEEPEHHPAIAIPASITPITSSVWKTANASKCRSAICAAILA